jgi:hypothetical protein
LPFDFSFTFATFGDRTLARPVCIEILEIERQQTRKIARPGSIGRNINGPHIAVAGAENKAEAETAGKHRPKAAAIR